MLLSKTKLIDNLYEFIDDILKVHTYDTKVQSYYELAHLQKKENFTSSAHSKLDSLKNFSQEDFLQLEKLVQKKILSPHVHERKSSVELIVLHKIALPLHKPQALVVAKFFQDPSFFKESSSQFLNSLKELRVSSHFVVDKCGTIIQCACPKNDVAWHCGDSIYQGRKKCNEFSVGIEFVGFDYEDLTSEQYHYGKLLIQNLLKSFGLSKKDICGHADISGGRKTDPGFLHFEKLV